LWRIAIKNRGNQTRRFNVTGDQAEVEPVEERRPANPTNPSTPGRFADRHLLFGAAFAQLVMRNYPIMVKERPESENNLFEFSCGGGKALVLFKYSTRPKSPWSFTVTSQQVSLIDDTQIQVPFDRRYLALICHLDGVCLLSHAEFGAITAPGSIQYGISVARPENGSYRVNGPGRVELDRRIPRNRWTKEILRR
jgi:hypothetical protein